jgi:hypothetical protein
MPPRAKERKDSVEPNNAEPIAEKPLLIRPMPRSDIAEPRWKYDSTETPAAAEPPTRIVRIALKLEPARTKWRRDTLLPSADTPNADNRVETRPNPRSDNDEPTFSCSTTDSRRMEPNR